MSKETVSRITDKVVEEMHEWASRPLEPVYAAVFIDAIVGPGWVTGRSLTGRSTAAIGVTVDGRKDVLGLWAGAGGEAARFSLSAPVDLKNRGERDVFFLVRDGLKSLPDVVGRV